MDIHGFVWCGRADSHQSDWPLVQSSCWRCSEALVGHEASQTISCRLRNQPYRFVTDESFVLHQFLDDKTIKDVVENEMLATFITDPSSTATPAHLIESCCTMLRQSTSLRAGKRVVRPPSRLRWLFWLLGSVWLEMWRRCSPGRSNSVSGHGRGSFTQSSRV